LKRDGEISREPYRESAMKHTEIAAVLGITAGYVSMAERAAIRKLWRERDRLQRKMRAMETRRC
jgi:DNA-directed RNA polymerase specialized sigma subunit